MAKKVEASNRVVKSSQLENKEEKKETNRHNQVEVARSGSFLEITKGSEKKKKTKDKVRKNRSQTEEKVGNTKIGALRNDEVIVGQSEAVVGNLLITCESKKLKKKGRIENGMAKEGKSIEEKKSKKKRMKEHVVLTEGGGTEEKSAKKKQRKELMKMKEGMVEKMTEEADLGDVNTKSLGDEDPSKGMKSEPKKSKKKKRKANDMVNESENIEEKKSEKKRRKEDEGLKEGGIAKEKKGKKNRGQDLMMLKKGVVKKKREEANASDVYIISSGDNDSSKGMKKWITEYHQKRPGLKVLQERIDEFIIVHEERLEREKRERESLAAEGGWTVVTHHKGRKKTTDSETGTTVGSVSQAAVEDQMTKKKPKELRDFYRFQKREAQRNELMALRNKYEQDIKRIQQLRAARKFRPY